MPPIFLTINLIIKFYIKEVNNKDCAYNMSIVGKCLGNLEADIV